MNFGCHDISNLTPFIVASDVSDEHFCFAYDCRQRRDAKSKINFKNDETVNNDYDKV